MAGMRKKLAKTQNPWMRKVDEPTRRAFKGGKPVKVFVSCVMSGGFSDDTEKRIQQVRREVIQNLATIQNVLTSFNTPVLSGGDTGFFVELNKKNAEALVKEPSVGAIRLRSADSGQYYTRRCVYDAALL